MPTPGTGAGGGASEAPPLPPHPLPSPPAAPERVWLPPQPAWLRLLRSRARRGKVRVPVGARPPITAPDTVCLWVPHAQRCRGRRARKGLGTGLQPEDGLLGELSLIPAASLYATSTQSSRSPGGGGARRVRALVSHSEGANHTLLRFSAGDVVEVLVPEARNGWLYGKLEGSSA